MKEEDRLESLKTKKLSLSYWDTLFYFLTPILLLVILPLALLLGPMLYEGRGELTQRDIIGSIIFVLVGLWLFSIQFNSLKLKEVRTTLPRQQLKEIIENTGIDLKGYVKEASDDFMILYLHRQRVTILFDADSVLINSILDPASRFNLASSTSLEKTTNKFVEEIRKANIKFEWENQQHAKE